MKTHPRVVRIAGREFGGQKLFFICGPCVIESAEHCQSIAGYLEETSRIYDLDLIFKASFDKANRTSLHSFRGPGLERGMEILAAIRTQTGLPILTDVHESNQVSVVAPVADVIQVPAFLCRQTDLIVAAASAGRSVNLKKGQFLAPWDMRHSVEKARSTGNTDIIVTERGSSFGYNNLVVDFRNLPIIQSLGYPVVLDVTHSLQLPGAAGHASGGQPQYIPQMARAAVAAGVDGLFFEVHDNPRRALSDGANALTLQKLRPLVETLLDFRAVATKYPLVWTEEGAP